MIEYIDERLKAIADMVKPNSRVADIGTDHAYLAIYLIQQEVATWVVASDINQGPFQVARDMVKKHNLENKIDVRLGNGLQTLAPREVDTVCIAGMGGGLIVKILETSPHIIKYLNSVVLQPMNTSIAIRRWLYTHDWSITDECLVESNDIIYEVIKAEPIKDIIPSEVLLEIGPIIAKHRTELFKKYINIKITKLKRAIEGMELSQVAKQSNNYHEAKKRLEEIGGILQ